MALVDIIKEIQKLNTADQLRLKEFFTKSLGFLKRYPSRNIKMATPALTVIRIMLSDSENIPLK